jgi:hypothetical protein
VVTASVVTASADTASAVTTSAVTALVDTGKCGHVWSQARFPWVGPAAATQLHLGRQAQLLWSGSQSNQLGRCAPSYAHLLMKWQTLRARSLSTSRSLGAVAQ